MKLSKFLNRRNLFISDKRQRFIFQTVFLTVCLLVTQLIWEDYRFIMVGIIFISSYILTAWSLSEDLKGIKWISLFILPVLFTATISLFYFLLPARWIIRLLIITTFALGTYASLLVENIYNVAVLRSIQLLRVAQSVGLLITLIILFFSCSIILSLRAYGGQNMLYLIPVTFLLALQSLWSVELEETFSKRIIFYSLLVSLGVGELVMAISFWPIQIASASLFITACFYTLIGIIQQHLFGRLFRNTVREYMLVFIFTLFLIFLTTKWG